MCLIAIAILSDEGNRKTATLIANKPCGRDLQRIASSEDCEYRFISTDKQAAIEWIYRAIEALDAQSRQAG